MLRCKLNYLQTLTTTTYLLMFCATLCQANVIDYRYAKAFTVQHRSIEDGLSQSTVNDIIQDQQGYIWLATVDGLNRFDSYEFEIFRHDDMNEYSLHENETTRLLEEPEKGIWIGTLVGLSFFNFEDKRFINYAETNVDLRGRVIDLVMDSDGRLWVASDSGVFYMDKNRRELKRLVTSDGAPSRGEVVSVTDSKYFVYVVGEDCLRRIDKISFEITNLCERQSLKILDTLNVVKVLAKDGILWIGTYSGLFKYDLENDSVVHFNHVVDDVNSLSSDYIQDILFDNTGTLWVATKEGVNAFNQDKQIFTRYQHKIYSEDGLSQNDIQSLYSDKDDSLWLGTSSGGFNILDLKQNSFEHLLTNSDVLDLGKNNNIFKIEKDSNENLWLASDGGGLIKYDLFTAKITRPLNDLGIKYSPYVYELLIDKNKRLWIAVLNGLMFWDLGKNKLIKTQFVINGTPTKNTLSVNQLLEDRHGELWLAMNHGVARVTKYEWVNDTLHMFLDELTDKFPESYFKVGTDVTNIMHDQNGDYWFGGRGGLVYYQTGKNKWRHFQHLKGNHQSLSNNIVQAIFEDSRGFVWVGTADGLNRVVRSNLDEDSIYFERITTHDGLPNNTIYDIREDDESQLWISTNSGLVKYAKDRHDMEIYRTEDGLSSDEFNTGASFIDNNGRLYFGSINGVTIIANQQPQKRESDTLLYFSSVLVGDRVIDTEILNFSKDPALTQRADETSVSIKMVNVNYTRLGSQRYRYRLIGLSDTWRYLGVERNISIVGLPEGSYLLEVQSRLADESWGQQPKRLKILVETSFWDSVRGYYLIAFITLFSFILTMYYISLFYKQKIFFINRKMDIEVLRLKEIRSDNENLMKELTSKDATASFLQKKIDSSNKKLEVEQYRDVTTGFYRLNYLYTLNDEFIDKIKTSGDPEIFDRYRATAIFELKDYSRLCRKYGILASAEFLSKVSIVIRQQMMSECQIFFVDRGMFLLVSGGQEYVKFESDIVNLANLVTRSEFEFANGLSSNTRVLITTIDLKEVPVRYPDNIGSIVPKQIRLHNQVEESFPQLNRSKFYFQISITNSNAFLESSGEDIHLNDMVEQGIINLEPL